MGKNENGGNGRAPTSFGGDGLAWEVIEALGQGVAIVGANGRFEYVNSAYAHLVARTPEALRGLSPFDVTHPDDQAKLQQAHRPAVSNEASTYEIRLLRPDGQAVYVHIMETPYWEAGQVVGSYMIVTDLVRPKEVEDNLYYQANLLENISDAVISTDLEANIQSWNKAAEKIYGWSAAETIGKPFADLITTEYVEYPEEEILAQLGQQDEWRGEVIQKRKDGRPLNILASVSLIRDSQGNPIARVAVTHDITERKQVEQRLYDNEKLLRTIAENFPRSYLSVINADMTLGFTSGQEFTLAGLDPEAFVGLHVQDVLSAYEEEMVEKIIAAYRQTFEGQEQFFELRVGERYQSHATVPLKDKKGEIQQILAVVQNITDHKRAIAALRRSETELQYIIDTVPEGVVLLAMDGSVRLTNPVADQFLNLLNPTWQNGPLRHLGQRPLPEILTAPPPGLWHEIAIDGYAFEVIARPVEERTENAGWVLVLRDVTQEKEMQKRVQLQERLAAVGQLAAGIAHDFNNIMAVITLYTQFILRTIDLPARVQERLHTIDQQAQRATELIQQILDFSRQSVLERRALDLLPFMKEWVKLLGRTLPEHIQIELIHVGGTYTVYGDPSRIQQMMMNLAVNARDAMSEGGRLQISLAHLSTREDNPPPLLEMPFGEWIEVQVVDSGSGIPKEVLPQIFEPFFTTKEVGKGTGLGLAQVYGIMQQHGGYIDVVTKLGQGTIFFLYFPALGKSDSAAVSLSKSPLKVGQGELILLVEDDPLTRRALVDSLELMNYRVLEVQNGHEALKMLSERLEEIDLVLSDVVMPEMGGPALLYAMQKQNIAIPLVFLTGHPLNQEMEQLQALGLAGWLSKPPNLVDLSVLLAQVLERPASDS